MSTLPRYALQLPDGRRWAYYLPDPERPPGTRTGLFADGDPLHRLEPLADPKGFWYVGDRHAERITATYQPQPKTVGYRLADQSALSERYPATLTVGQWDERAGAGHEEYWELYERVTEDQPEVQHVYEGPFRPLEGRQPPSLDEPQWRADLPHELTQRPEYRHLFPGHIPGLKQHLAELIKEMPRVHCCFVDYHGISGIHVVIRVPFDEHRTRFVPNVGRNNRPLKSGRTVPVLVDRRLDLPVPEAMPGDTYAAALVEWEHQVTFWLRQVEDAAVDACSACEGKGYIAPEGNAPTAAEARARLTAMVPLESEADEAEFTQRIDAVVAAETAELLQQVRRVRSFATGHEYKWLHELLDGFGAHGGHL
ncbi:hypothetical protein ABT039_22520 [Streptomyces lasiicapitis]|uniref:hypothetical protein n=1 Tax=Streptomyces lasiicapitis TaxID=1923961 RepID=UPI0033177A3F